MQPPHGKISVIQLLLLVFLVVSAAATAYQLYYLPHFAPRSAREFHPVLSRDEPIEVASPIIRGKIEKRMDSQPGPQFTAQTQSPPSEAPINPALMLPGRLADSAQDMLAGLALRTKDLSSLLAGKPEPESPEPSLDEPAEPAVSEPVAPDGFPTEITDLGPLALSTAKPDTTDSPPVPADSPPAETDSPPVTIDSQIGPAGQKPSVQTDAKPPISYCTRCKSVPLKPEEANQTMAKLGQAPFTVYSYPIDINGKTHFRVRVGFFKTYDEAKRASDRIAALASDLPKPWVTPVAPREFADYHRGPTE